MEFSVGHLPHCPAATNPWSYVCACSEFKVGRRSKLDDADWVIGKNAFTLFETVPAGFDPPVVGQRYRLKGTDIVERLFYADIERNRAATERRRGRLSNFWDVWEPA